MMLRRVEAYEMSRPTRDSGRLDAEYSQVVAGLLRVSLCSVVLGGAKCNGRHAEFVNKIKGQF